MKSRIPLWTLAALSLLTAGISEAAISVGIDATRTSCVAPCLIHFDGFTPSDDPTLGESDEFRQNFVWDFGDPGSGTYSTNGKSRNTAAGPLAAHLFDNPGSYVVKLDVNSAGGSGSALKTINVSDAASLTTVCISASGDFSGCPANAALQVQTSQYDAALGTHLRAGRRILFRRGDTFATSNTLTFNGVGPGIVGAFGSGPRPIINLASVNRHFYLSCDWTVMDMDFRGNGGLVFGSTPSSCGATSRNLILRVLAAGVISLWDTPLNAIASGSDMFSDNALVDVEVETIPGIPATYPVFSGGERLVLLGGRYTATDNYEHTVRIQWCRKCVLSNNVITMNMINGVGKHALKLHAVAKPGWPNFGIPTQWVVISDNEFVGNGISWIVQIAPQNNQPNEGTEFIEDLIFDRNFIRGQAPPFGPRTAFQGDVRRLTARNNIFYLDSGGDAHGLVLDQTPVKGVPPTHAHIINNTCYSPNQGSGSGTCITLRASPQPTHVAQNNVYHAPQRQFIRILDGQFAVNQMNIDDGLTGGLTGTPFVSANPTEPIDFAPSATSDLNNSGALTSNALDFFLKRRPSSATSVDVGAVEFGAGAPAAPILLP